MELRTIDIENLKVRLGYKEEITLTREEFMALIGEREAHVSELETEIEELREALEEARD